jgi:GT2 family glycosyltransferase
MKGDRSHVSVGLVTWNSVIHLPACLDGLEAQRGLNLELIVVDNGSTDRSLDLVRQRWPSAVVIANPTNEGYCRAHNAAICASRGAYYLALNPDVQLLPGFIKRLASALESHPACGSAVGK